MWESDRGRSPYHYSFNNPLNAKDPNGKFAFAIPLALPTVLGWVGLGTATVGTAGIIVMAATEGVDDDDFPDPLPPMDPNVPDANNATEDENSGSNSSNDGGGGSGNSGNTNASDIPKGQPGAYAPDRELPRTEHGVIIPDSPHPHTQLGIRNSKSKPGTTYPQARELDENGKPVRDIDFTDHGRPQNHPNPHQHEWNSKTGARDKKAKPLESRFMNWKFTNSKN